VPVAGSKSSAEARGAAKSPEPPVTRTRPSASKVAICRALGAAPARLVRQHLLEGLALWVLGGAAGTLLAWGATRAVRGRMVMGPMGLIEARMNIDTPLVRGKWASEFAYLPDWERFAEVAEWCEEHLKPILDALNKDLHHGFGEDFARSGDLTVLDIMEEGCDLITRVRGQIELANCPFTQQEQIVFYILSRLPRFRSAAFDARGNGQYLAERAAQKFGQARVEQVMLSDSFYLANMPRFKTALQDATLIDIPKDNQVRDDLRALKLIDGIPKLGKAKTQNGEGEKLQRHGDSAISLFLGHYAMKREVIPIEFQSSGHRVASSGRMAGYM